MTTHHEPNHVCPFCCSPHLQVVGSTGVKGDVTEFRCSRCERQWGEVQSHLGEDDDTAIGAAPVSKHSP